MAVLCLLFKQSSSQNLEIVPFQIGERVPDLPLKNILNYKDSTATLSSFGNKLIILDFWATWCTSCIQTFPFEDSLQSIFNNDVQFLLITRDAKEKVATFLNHYNRKQKKPLGLPVVVDDKIFYKLFRFRSIPHYVWLAPNGEVLAESNDYFITSENILNTLLPIRAEEKRLRGNKYAEINTKMQKPAPEIQKILSITDN